MTIIIIGVVPLNNWEEKKNNNNMNEIFNGITSRQNTAFSI